MILDHSMFAGIADMHDRHRDMRLDVDNMSYEVNLVSTFGSMCLWKFINTMKIPDCAILLNLIGAIGSGRTHRKCQHRIE
jgi:hypothetical protein